MLPLLTPMLVALLIPIAYSLSKKKGRKTIFLITLCSILVVISYPLVSFLSSAIPHLGYTMGKFILFVLFPIVTILYIEKWKIRDIFSNLGVRIKGVRKSIAYGTIAAIVTVIITIAVYQSSGWDFLSRTIMFFEAFTEEFFFRGFLFLYLLTKTNLKIAYATSILGFVLIHPQHFTSLFLLSTIAQAILLTIVADKTRNIIGCWIGHGLNRFLPALIRTFFGV